MPTLLAAKVQKGMAIPNAAITNLPSAGLAARPMLKGDAIGGGRAVEILLGHQHRYRRPPCGRSESAADAKQECRHQQERGRGEIQGDQTGENHGHREDRDFDRNKQASGIRMTSAKAPRGKCEQGTTAG